MPEISEIRQLFSVEIPLSTQIRVSFQNQRVKKYEGIYRIFSYIYDGPDLHSLSGGYERIYA